MAETRTLPTPPPEVPVAIILPPPPPSASGSVGASIPWSGPTGYVDGDGSLAWPVPGGYVSQYFWGGHQGVDIAHTGGGAVVAADTGTVISAGWVNNGGGMVITIAHADGRTTQYNHLGAILVAPDRAWSAASRSRASAAPAGAPDRTSTSWSSSTASSSTRSATSSAADPSRPPVDRDRSRCLRTAYEST